MLGSVNVGNVFQLDAVIDTIHVTVNTWPTNTIQFHTHYNDTLLLAPTMLTCGGCREAKLPLESVVESMLRDRKSVTYNHARCSQLCACAFVARVAILYRKIETDDAA